jgi:hypothetical protein
MYDSERISYFQVFSLQESRDSVLLFWFLFYKMLLISNA